MMLRTLAACGLALSLPFTAQAHRAWILPAATVLSGEAPWVTFDAAVSNDIFHTDFHPLRAPMLSATGPDGAKAPLQNVSTGRFRTTFDLELASPGTYKVFVASHGLSATWEEDGERRFWPPRGQPYTDEGFAANVPERADKLAVTQFSRRIETFVTAGAPDDAALAASDIGLELMPDTHPNDLFAGETARFRFLIDGAPAEGVEVTVLPGGMRYRNEQDEITLRSDGEGFVDITWPAAGQYFLEAEYSDDQARAPSTRRRGGYAATFEVLPGL